MKGVKFLLPIMFLTLIFALAGILVFNPKGGNKKESNGFQPNFDVDIPDEPAKEEISISFKDGTKRTEIDAYFKSINAEIIREIKPLNTFIIKTSTEPDALPESTEIAYKEQNFYIGAMGENGSESKEPLVPNDPLFKDQWAFQAINTEDLWNKVLDQEQNLEEHATIVAVIDSGICSDHPELSERVIEGYDFIDDDNQPQDALGHGCGVAGVIAANTNNTIGIASFAPNAKILPIKVLNEKGIGTYSDLAAGIVFAVDRKADIINLSLGGYEDSELLREAVGYATDHNVKIIAAAGNTGNETVLYPAKYEEVTAVGSVDNRINEKSKTYETSTFSSRGKEIDIWAPGSEILTLARDGDYQKVNGTSFAASVVTAVMANNDLGNFKAVFEKPNIEQTKQNTISKTQNLKLNFSNIEQGTDIPDDLQKVLLSEIQLWPLKVPESREFNVGSMRLEGTWGIATIVPVLSKQELENMESLNSSYSLLFSFNGTTWEASFKGGENIDKILTNISDSELPSDIKDFYKKSDSITAQSNSQQYMNYKMPWHQSKAFPLTQGWHANHFENELSSSLDFGVTQGNQILSSGPGIVSQVCKNTNGQQAWIIISTKEGATIYTDKLYYLHIKHNTMPSNIQNGASVNTGIVLGEITGAVTEEEGWPCPMKSTGAHLHFATNFGPKELAMGEYDFTATELPSGNLTSTNSDNAVSLISPSQNYPVNRYLDPSTAMNFAWNVFEKDGKIAEKYHIAAADNTAFSNPFFSLPSLISTSYSTTLGRFGDSEEVYWKVKACYENCQDANPNNYVWSDWSEVRKIKLIVPTPVINSPANNAIVDDALTININKGNLYGHDSNILYEIDSNSNFASPEFEKWTSSTTITATLSDPGEYFIRVRQLGDDSHYSDYSQIVSVSVRKNVSTHADYDGDGKDDLSWRRSDGKWFIDHSSDGFSNYWDVELSSYGHENDAAVPADYDGDGKADPSVRTIDGKWYIDYSNNGLKSFDVNYSGYRGEDSIAVPADYDGDGKDDLAIRINDDRWCIDYYAIGGFGSFNSCFGGYHGEDSIPVPADYDGDGKDDLAIRLNDDRWCIDYAEDGFGTFISGDCYNGYRGDDSIPVPADYDGDGKDDLAIRLGDDRWCIDYALGGYGSFGSNCFTGYRGTDSTPVAGDFDGDNKADLGIRIMNAEWHIDYAGIGGFGSFDSPSGGYLHQGKLGFQPASADYDGDDLVDKSIKRDDGRWMIDYANNNYGAWDLVLPGYKGTDSVAVPGNYDGIGGDDIAIRRNDGKWCIDYAQDGFGLFKTEDCYSGYRGTDSIPAPADYDNDGKTDLSIRISDSRWCIDYAQGGFGSFGSNCFTGYRGTDSIPVPANYDGIGGDDLSIRVNDGRWCIDHQSNGFGSFDLCYSGYRGTDSKPVPGDYDGDGKYDLAIKTDAGNLYIDYKNDGFGSFDLNLPGYGNTSFIPVAKNYDNKGGDDLSLYVTNGTFLIDYQTNNFGSFDELDPRDN